MKRSCIKIYAAAFAVLALALAQGLAPPDSLAEAKASVLRLPGRSVSAAGFAISRRSRHGIVRALLRVTIRNVSRGSFAVSGSDFALTTRGTIIGITGWDARAARVTVAPRRSSVLRLTFTTRQVITHASLFYRAQRVAGILPLNSSTGVTGGLSPANPLTGAPPTLTTFRVSQARFDPWGTAVDQSGNLWFAEPGCNFTPTCARRTPPGLIGEIQGSSHTVRFYTLPNIRGNQPIFLAFDSAGKLWFTTPNNSRIGEFNPARGTFVGQWRVTPGSGPWDLTIATGKIWYTEHLGSALGAFNLSSHVHQDFQTPSANSNPYGIAAAGSLVWFTENNGNVDRVASLNTSNGAIAEYPIALPVRGTPHMITVDSTNHPWWTEGFLGTIATLNPALATPGQCGTVFGTCNGIQRFQLPPSTRCSTATHTSGIVYDGRRNRLWLANSLTAQIGSFDPSTDTFTMNNLDNCGAHPYDGLSTDAAGNVWFDEEFGGEEFGGAISELTP